MTYHEQGSLLHQAMDIQSLVGNNNNKNNGQHTNGKSHGLVNVNASGNASRIVPGPRPDPGPTPKKTRRRLKKACLGCASRKVKCDGGRPRCSHCVRLKLTYCKYDEANPFQESYNNNTQITPTTTSTTSTPMNNSDKNEELDAVKLRQENEFLRARVMALKRKQMRKRSSSVGSSDCDAADGSSSSGGGGGGDDIDQAQIMFQERLKQSSALVMKSNRTFFMGFTSLRAIFDRHKQYYINNMLPARKQIGRSRREYKDYQSTYLSLMSIPDGTLKPELLLAHLPTFLPSYDTVWVILMEYLNGIWHKMMPIIDRDVFLADFERIFQRDSDDGDKITLRIENKVSDHSRIALVLAVMKFILIAQDKNGAKMNSMFVDYDEMLLKYIDHFLQCAKYSTRTSFPTLQTMLLLRIIKKFDPGDGDGGDGSNGSIMFSTVVEMAYTLALHQDIDHWYHTAHERTTAKNIWRCILYLDAMNSFDMGMPLKIQAQFANVEQADDGSMIYKMTVCLRNIMDSILRPTLTFKKLQNLADDLNEFAIDNLDPIYSTIDKLNRLSIADPMLLMDAIISVHVFQILSTLSSLIEWCCCADTKTEIKRRYHVRVIRLRMMSMFAYVDLLSVVEKFNHPSVTCYSKNQYTMVVEGFLALAMTRAIFHTFKNILEIIDPDCPKERLFYHPSDELHDEIGPAEAHQYTIPIHRWQMWEYEEQKTDQSICLDLRTISRITSELAYIVYNVKRKYMTVSDNPNRYALSFFLKLYITHHMKREFEENELLILKTTPFHCPNVSVEYGDIATFKTTSFEHRVKQEVKDEIENLMLRTVSKTTALTTSNTTTASNLLTTTTTTTPPTLPYNDNIGTDLDTEVPYDYNIYENMFGW